MYGASKKLFSVVGSTSPKAGIQAFLQDSRLCPPGHKRGMTEKYVILVEQRA